MLVAVVLQGGGHGMPKDVSAGIRAFLVLDNDHAAILTTQFVHDGPSGTQHNQGRMISGKSKTQ
ncbi:MAG: hypothetical protein RL156_268, partial [Bacteroidota bacterium]